METGSFIGIDFGTANTTIVQVVRDADGEKVTVLGEDGQTPFAALAAITAENKVFFGSRVKKSFAALSENAKLVTPLASFIGTDKNITINNKECSPRQFTAEYFRALKRVVMKKHNVNITEAAISFPADFSHEAKLDLFAAARKAEINVTAVIPEHFAAFSALRGLFVGKKYILSADWGGASLKINILENNEGRLRVKMSRSKKIGGRDVDVMLAEKLHAMLGNSLADKSKAVPFDKMPAAERDKLITIAEAAKIEISEKGGEIAVNVPDYGFYGTNTLRLTEELFAEIVKPLMREHIVSTVNSAMEHAKLRASDIGAVLAIGGSCGLKAFSGVLRSMFGEEKLIIPDKPQIAAAKGTALAAAMNIGEKLRLAEDIGILMSDDTVFPLLKKDQPAAGLKSKLFTFGTVDDSSEAQVVLAYGTGAVIGAEKIPVDGFPEGNIKIEAEIDETLSARVKVHSGKSSDSEAAPAEDSGFMIGLADCYFDISDNG